MDFDRDIIGQAGLEFFGKMSASISHEIKNTLAIINEKAGLLDDLAAYAEKGVPVDPQRLKTQAEKITNQIRRADGIIKKMNRFAHSIDEAVKDIDLGETVELVKELSARIASMSEITLEAFPPAEPVTLSTNPFLLQNLIWLCIDFAIRRAGPGKTIALLAEGAEKGGKIRFARLEGLTDGPIEEFPGEKEKAILQALGADLVVNIGAMEITLIVSGVEEK